MSLDQIIRQKREELGLTLEETSRRVGFIKPYLSTIETGKVNNPPSDELLRKLEQTLQFETGLLVHIAHMEKLPADIRRSFEESKAQDKITSSPSKPSTATEATNCLAITTPSSHHDF